MMPLSQLCAKPGGNHQAEQACTLPFHDRITPPALAGEICTRDHSSWRSAQSIAASQYRTAAAPRHDSQLHCIQLRHPHFDLPSSMM